MEQDPRSALSDVQRVVVKIGTKSIIGGDGGRFSDVARQTAELMAQGKELVVVSSGAIALGFSRLGLSARPTQIAELQASAAAGQSRLMHAYEEAFAPYGLEVAQVLLTHDGMAKRELYLNARAAIDALLAHRCTPVINENDTVAVDEIRFGDNDQLAAMVSTLVGADLLVLLTDVEGLLAQDGRRISVVSDLEQARRLVRPLENGGLSLGGMASKLEAARRATLRGMPVVIADARDPAVLSKVTQGEDVGTLVLPQGSTLASRKHWIAYALHPRGAVLVDPGAAQALRQGRGSLLPVGILGVRGEFGPGDPISIIDVGNGEMARGLCRYGMEDVARLAGVRAQEIEARIGRYAGDAVVHRDDLVLL